VAYYNLLSDIWLKGLRKITTNILVLNISNAFCYYGYTRLPLITHNQEMRQPFE